MPTKVELETGLVGIECSSGRADEWGCSLDSVFRWRGPVEAKLQENLRSNAYDPSRAVYGYVEIEGEWYARRITSEGENLTFRLRQVTAAQVLDNVSRDRSALSGRERTLLDRGRLTTHSPLAWEDRDGQPREGRFVADGDRYYVLWEHDTDPPRVPPPADRVLRGALVALGLAGFYRGTRASR